MERPSTNCCSRGKPHSGLCSSHHIPRALTATTIHTLCAHMLLPPFNPTLPMSPPVGTNAGCCDSSGLPVHAGSTPWYLLKIWSALNDANAVRTDHLDTTSYRLSDQCGLLCLKWLFPICESGGASM